MQSSDRKVFNESQSRADSAFHIPWTVSSTDTGQLTFLKGGGFVRGAQVTPSASPADDVGGLAVEKHHAAADEYRADGGVVAVDHAGQPAVLVDRLLGVLVQRRVEAFGIDDDDIGPVSDA